MGPIIQYGGMIGAVFVGFYLMFKSFEKKSKEYADAIARQSKEHADEMSKLMAQTFKLNADCLDVISYNSTVMARLVEQINANNFCPIVRKETGKE
ncbi:MAG: hypothetical protein M0Z75_13000 [Nitrospiraceae bacterium]|nr:hypothetical protein [Nitrospiraceae bacterium]